ncbi:MAG: hypothetical protein P8N51_17340 [Pseudomonadales bacterium]|jgi:hypothetical protein|nr:hypothetical protein [Pseudomonadales bacterium]MDG1444516.1 hypothetical protein [Pseudomonadales bacterium]
MIGKIIGLVFSPIVFSIAFLAPLIAQSLTALNISFDGIPNIAVGLVIGGCLGLMAHLRGSWVWVK